ncbi:MAG: sulfatase-like hydrolase/transferase [Chlamydiota bacterium]
MKKLLSIRQEIPYIYLSLFFLLLFLQTLSHVLSTPNTTFLENFSLLLYGTGQSLLEVFLIFSFQLLCKKIFPKKILLVLMGLLFFLFLCHIVNFVVIKLLDVTFAFIFQLFFAEGPAHYLATLRAINLHSFTAVIAIVAILSVPFVGGSLYYLCQKVSNRHSLFISNQTLGLLIIGTLSIVISLEHFGWPFLEKQEKKFPWTFPLLTHEKKSFIIPLTMQEPKNEKELSKLLESKNFHIAKKPNIYLFIVESFRKDAIQKKIAPHLFDFAKENLSFPFSIANATASQVSWFSIFHSSFPYHWNTYRKSRETGSFPLQILKKMGYTITLSSSAELNYFTMDTLIFGKEKYLADHYHEMNGSLPACERDLLSMQGIDYSKKEGNVFIVFLDSTHSEYSYPKDMEPFHPVVDYINYVGLCSSKKDLPLIKNRYYNAVHYIDHLLGSFFTKLQENQLWDNSIIVVTGDHGEEFFEEGALFHGSHLNIYQTHIPIFYKFPEKRTTSTIITSQMDIFPSILHYISGTEEWSDFYDGESIFHKTWPYVITAKQKGSYTPTELLLQGEDYKISVKLEEGSVKKKFHLLSIKKNYKAQRKEEPTIFSVFKKIVESPTQDLTR